VASILAFDKDLNREFKIFAAVPDKDRVTLHTTSSLIGLHFGGMNAQKGIPVLVWMKRQIMRKTNKYNLATWRY